jgi:hypothetical protein
VGRRQQSHLDRCHRSLSKIGVSGAGAFDADDWAALLAGNEATA